MRQVVVGPSRDALWKNHKVKHITFSAFTCNLYILPIPFNTIPLP